MNYYKPSDWLKIQVANSCGLDKVTYEERIAAFDSLTENQAENYMLYRNTMKAYRDFKEGKPSGIPIMLDACSSGLQVLSAITGCIDGCKATGLINTGRRPNAYRDIEAAMKRRGVEGEIEYDDIKKAAMTHFYGSKQVPLTLLGEEVLEPFYEACKEVLPGAMKATNIMLRIWNQKKNSQSWRMPDGYFVYCPTVVKNSAVHYNEEIEEYFNFFYQEQTTLDKGISNAANITHSIDAYILRSLIRHCSYNEEDIRKKLKKVEKELGKRTDYKESSIIYPDITKQNYEEMKTEELMGMFLDLQDVLIHPSFSVLTVHDCFACHPNHVNRMRYWYNTIIARLTDICLLDDIVGQILEEDVYIDCFDYTVNKNDIIENDYAIC